MVLESGNLKRDSVGPTCQNGIVNLPPQAPAAKRNPLLIILIAVGAGCLCLGVLLAAILVPVFSQARLADKKTTSLSNLRQISTGMLIYSYNNNDRLPYATDWERVVLPEMKGPEVFNSPFSTPEKPVHYLMNQDLSNVALGSIRQPNETAMLFEGVNGTAYHAGRSANLHEQNGKVLIAFADGACKWVDKSVAPNHFLLSPQQ